MLAFSGAAAGSAPCSAAAGCSGAAAGGEGLLEQALAKASSQLRAMIVVAFICESLLCARRGTRAPLGAPLLCTERRTCGSEINTTQSAVAVPKDLCSVALR